jgi:hypothetical protein
MWDNMGAGIGYTMAPPYEFEHMQRQDNTDFFSSITDFFSYDPTSASGSLIPPSSGSQHVLHTPPPPHVTHTKEDERQYGRSHREPHPPRERLSPSGCRHRQPRPHRQG